MPLKEMYQPGVENAASARVWEPVKAVQDAKDALNLPASVIMARVSSSASRVMDDDGLLALFGEGELSGEGAALDIAGGIVVVIVEAAFTDRRGAALEECAQ